MVKICGNLWLKKRAFGPPTQTRISTSANAKRCKNYWMQVMAVFLGGLTADKHSKITGASKATATRDLTDLLQKGGLISRGVGKATKYYVNVPGWNQSALPLPGNSFLSKPGISKDSDAAATKPK